MGESVTGGGNVGGGEMGKEESEGRVKRKKTGAFFIEREVAP